MIHHGDAAEAHIAAAYNAYAAGQEKLLQRGRPLTTRYYPLFTEVFMERLIKARKNGKFQQIIEPGTMRFLDFATLQLDKGERHSLQTGAREYVLDIFSGAITLTITTVGTARRFTARSENARMCSPDRR